MSFYSKTLEKQLKIIALTLKVHEIKCVGKMMYNTTHTRNSEIAFNLWNFALLERQCQLNFWQENLQKPLYLKQNHAFFSFDYEKKEQMENLNKKKVSCPI